MFERHFPEAAGHRLCETVRLNCDISDARDHGIYSMCSMVLKLRNLYKWEHGIEPWQEPDVPDLLDWIESKETYWLSITADRFHGLDVDGKRTDPFDLDSINDSLAGTNLYYGAGYGRSMKAVFFLAEERDRLVVEGCPVVLLGTELMREMAAPFAMAQDGQIIIRQEPLRFFLWDHIQELRSSCRHSYLYTLQTYGLLSDGALDQHKFKNKLDHILECELDLFIYHEIGELLETALDSRCVGTVIGRFPGSVIEFVCRAVKDVLADTHPCGVLSHICRERKRSSLGLYVSFLDGLRKELFPEMGGAWKQFFKEGDWAHIELARDCCRKRLQETAGRIGAIAEHADNLTDQEIIAQFNETVLAPLNLEMPQDGEVSVPMKES